MTGERKYDVILLDVDGTLLNFDQAEADGMRVVLREYGFEPTDELLEAYHQVNNAYWAAFERGEVTKERAGPASGSRHFSGVSARPWTALRWRACTAGSWTAPRS